MSTTAIFAQDLVKRYGSTTAVDSVSLDIRHGEVFGLLGPNGAGKTTTILMLLGLTDITSGTVRVLDLDPSHQVLQVKRQVGYMPDAIGFYDNLSAWQNLRYSARLAGVPAAQQRERIGQALERVRLADVANKPVATFSRGMRQRLGLAEILLKRARIAILDEPTSGLDPLAAEDFLGLIGELRHEGICIVLSSHMLDHMQRICDRVALFHQGRIALTGTVDQLANRVLGGHRHVSVRARGTDMVSVLSSVPGVQSVTPLADNGLRLLVDRDARSDIASAIIRAGGELQHLADDAPSLDVIYNRYFQTLKQETQHAT